MRSLICLALSAVAALAADTHKLVRVYEKLPTERPIAVVIPDDGTQRQFLALQRGKILLLPADQNAAEAKTFLDLSTRGMEAKDGLFEEGLNGLAFHPKFKDNGLFYLCYTMQKPKRLIITEMRANGDVADEKTERVILEIPMINWNHHGGNILFGPDGYLYMGMGDNSKRNGELKMSQLNATLYGKILRLDVNSREYANAYGIPADNPYANGVNALPQIYATGIRNPWGLSFDTKGHLWCADVGQDLYEEINWITNGGNYGWQFREGPVAFALCTDTPPADAKFIEPIHSYNHAEGLSITGGYVYTGTAFPELTGAYVYGDFILGKVWALKTDDAGKVLSNNLLFASPLLPAPENPKKKPAPLIKPTAFCPAANGDILVLDWNGGIYKLAQ